MKFQKHLSKSSIRHLIPYYWTLEKKANVEQESLRLIPDGYVEWIFQFGTPWSYNFGQQKNKHSDSTQFFGQLKNYMTVEFPKEEFSMLAVKFQPWAARYFWGIDMKELTEQHVPLSELRSKDYSRLEEQLSGCKSISERIQLLDQYFESRLNNYENKGIKKYIDHLSNSKSSFASIEFDKSPRRIQQLFKNEIGINPKLFHQTIRINRIISDLFSQQSQNLTQLAYRYNFADQSHLIKEFKRFTGYAPRNFIAHSRLDGDMFNLKCPDALALN